MPSERDAAIGGLVLHESRLLHAGQSPLVYTTEHVGCGWMSSSIAAAPAPVAVAVALACRVPIDTPLCHLRIRFCETTHVPLPNVLVVGKVGAE
jgi:hypothetical protein